MQLVVRTGKIVYQYMSNCN